MAVFQNDCLNSYKSIIKNTYQKNLHESKKTGYYQSTLQNLVFSFVHFSIWSTDVKSSSTYLNEFGKAFQWILSQHKTKCKEELSLEWRGLAYMALTLLISSLAALSTTGPISTSVKTFDSATHQRRTSAPYGGSLVWSSVETERHTSKTAGGPAAQWAVPFCGVSAVNMPVSVPRRPLYLEAFTLFYQDSLLSQGDNVYLQHSVYRQC